MPRITLAGSANDTVESNVISVHTLDGNIADRDADSGHNAKLGMSIVN